MSHKYFYEVVERVRSIVGSRGTTIGFGHVGDSNVHINVAVENKNYIQEVFEDLPYSHLRTCILCPPNLFK